jgi:hypothetical protein
MNYCSFFVKKIPPAIHFNLIDISDLLFICVTMISMINTKIICETNKCNDIAEILVQLALNTKQSIIDVHNLLLEGSL